MNIKFLVKIVVFLFLFTGYASAEMNWDDYKNVYESRKNKLVMIDVWLENITDCSYYYLDPNSIKKLNDNIYEVNEYQIISNNPMINIFVYRYNIKAKTEAWLYLYNYKNGKLTSKDDFTKTGVVYKPIEDNYEMGRASNVIRYIKSKYKVR